MQATPPEEWGWELHFEEEQQGRVRMRRTLSHNKQQDKLLQVLIGRARKSKGCCSHLDYHHDTTATMSRMVQRASPMQHSPRSLPMQQEGATRLPAIVHTATAGYESITVQEAQGDTATCPTAPGEQQAVTLAPGDPARPPCCKP